MSRSITALVILAVIAGVAVWVAVRTGFSSRPEPSAAEAWFAGHVRRASIPEKYRKMKNPVSCTPDVLKQAEAHWADHCATCHGNNGNGDTLLGKTMYPRPPLMTAEGTQQQSDGELYYTINNGVRLTGMPAFGPPGDSDTDSWKLVCFIRHIPQLTSDEADEMKKLNPKTPEDLEEEKREQDFLNGGSAPAPAEHRHHM